MSPPPGTPASPGRKRLAPIIQGLRTRLGQWWRSRPSNWLERLVDLAGIVIGVGWLVVLFLPHLKLISQPGPQEYNEPSIWQVTFMLDHGRNPYTADELPGAAMCFSPLYNFVVLAFKPLFGIDYPAHRMVNLLFFAASLWLLVRWMRRAGASLGIALLSMALYYWMCLDNIMMTARPDNLGFFFFLLALFVPWENNYSRWPSIFGLVCAVVAFQCKFYFALAGCATLLGVFFVRSRGEAVRLGFEYFAALILSVLIFNLYFPFYFIETVTIQFEAAVLNSNDGISVMHTLMFFERTWPFLLVLLGGVGAWLWRRHTARRTGAPALLPGSEAWYGEMRFRMLGSVFLIYLALVYFYMGRNGGGYFTYHLHLLYPLIFVLAALMLRRPWHRVVVGLLLAVFVMRLLDVPDKPDAAGPYRRLEQLIFNSKGEILGIPCTTDIFARTSRRVLHDGSSMFLGFALARDRADRDPLAAIILKKFDEVEQEAKRKVAAREYEMVLTEFDAPMYCDEALLKKNYDKVEQVDYYTYFGHSPVRVWRPKPQEPDAGAPPAAGK